jgi:hypothetical protein
LRRASSVYMEFYRLDYPEKDPDKWHKLLPIRQIDGRIESRELSCNHHLEPPNAPTYEENYQGHCEG